jgi:hypothetical protein
MTRDPGAKRLLAVVLVGLTGLSGCSGHDSTADEADPVPLGSTKEALNGIVTVSFSGTLTSLSAYGKMANGGALAVGDTVTGALTYDSSQFGSAGIYTFTGSSKAHALSVKFFNSSGQQLFSDSYSGGATAYYSIHVAQHAPGATLTVLCDTIYKTGLGQSGPANPAIVVTLTTTQTWPTSNPLPTPTTIAQFNASGATIGY